MANFCPQCGAPLTPTSKFCPQCGAKIATAVLQEAALNADARQEAATAHTAEEQAPVQQPVTETSKEESVSPHFTTPQSPQKPKNAEDYLQMLRADLTIEGRLNRKRYWVRTGLCIVLNIMAAIFMEIPAELPIFFGAILTIAVAAVTLGGLQSIAAAASRIVPAMAILYMLSTIGILVMFHDLIPMAIGEIFRDAFTPTAAQGGFLGATVLFAMRNGIARGVFSNESGLGSAPIVAAAAKTDWPAEQGLISMTGTFIDTIIICTMTGLTIVIGGLWTGDLNGAALTNATFLKAYPQMGGYLLMVGLVLFAFTTILGWNYYGERCVEYLFGVKGIMPYRIIFIILIGLGAFLKLEAIWILADIVNGLMAIPNLIALLGLSGAVVAETKRYFAHLKETA